MTVILDGVDVAPAGRGETITWHSGVSGKIRRHYDLRAAKGS